MRRVSAIVRATALEILSEPLSLLLLLAALTIATLAPAFHYHQFGEASRMARDAGLSALFLGGTLFAVFGILRSFRREIDSGTLQMALAHPISRTGFFLGKLLGALVAQLVFWTILSATTVTLVNGAEIGGRIALKAGGIARLWGPSLALGVATIVLPLVLAAALNRFGRFRFVPTTTLMALAFALGGMAYAFRPQLALRLVPVFLLLLLFALVFLVASAAFAVRFRANLAVTLTGLVLVAFVPVIGNYYLSDALAKGGQVAWSYVGLATLATAPGVGAFVLLGLHFFNTRDLGEAN